MCAHTKELPPGRKWRVGRASCRQPVCAFPAPWAVDANNWNPQNASNRAKDRAEGTVSRICTCPSPWLLPCMLLPVPRGAETQLPLPVPCHVTPLLCSHARICAIHVGCQEPQGGTDKGRPGSVPAQGNGTGFCFVLSFWSARRMIRCRVMPCQESVMLWFRVTSAACVPSAWVCLTSDVGERQSEESAFRLIRFGSKLLASDLVREMPWL